jgi:uncharacterized protein
MVVSLVQFIIQLPESTNLKDKRRVVHSLTKKLQTRFHLSAAEVDLLESTGYCQIGAALVSNSKRYGDTVMQKVIAFVEDDIPGRIHDVSTHTEYY